MFLSKTTRSGIPNFACSIIEWTFIKTSSIIALGLKVVPPLGLQVLQMYRLKISKMFLSSTIWFRATKFGMQLHLIDFTKTHYTSHQTKCLFGGLEGFIFESPCPSVHLDFVWTMTSKLGKVSF